MKPISFALIGKEVIFEKLDAKLIGYGVAIVILGCCVSILCFFFLQYSDRCSINCFYFFLQCRLLLSYALLYGADLNWQERLYITICGLPKATVQVNKFFIESREQKRKLMFEKKKTVYRQL